MRQSDDQNHMFEIRRLKILSVARILTLICTVLYLLTGFVVIVLYGGVSRLLVGTLTSSLSVFSVFLVWLAGTLGVLAVSFCTGLLIGWLYNIFARWWGGIQVELGKVESPVQNEDLTTEKK